MSDSDSETDLLAKNVLTFQNQGLTVCAKGPNINSTNISSLSFRSNTMSGVNMPWNMERPRYAASVCDPRSMGYRREREVSPMSCRSASGLQPRNFQHSYYPGGSSSYRNMYNGRSGSPMSVRSSRTIDSNTSMSAKDIAFALQNWQFSKFEEQILKAACNKYMKNRSRRRIEKKRNIKMFLKGFRRRSGGDSGDQASNSSISDDDCRSIRSSRSTLHKANIPSCRSNITDNVSHFRKLMRENDMVRDRTDDFRQNYFKHMLPVEPPQVKDVAQPRCQNTAVQNNMLKSNILLPSQRFNQSAASTVTERPSTLQSICEDNILETRSTIPNKNKQQLNRKNIVSDSEQDDIFGETTVIAMNKNGKRSLEEGNVPVPDSKKSKFLSPPKNHPKPKTPKQKQLNTSIKLKSSDFEFAKPQLPIKKLGIVKNTKKIVLKVSKSQNSTTSRKSQDVGDSNPKPSDPVPERMVPNLISNCEEKLISSSLTAKPTPSLQPKQSASRLMAIDEQEKEPCPRAESTQFSTTDMSMRPSFIKRKLFTQKIEEIAKNSSSDSLQADSPQNNLYSKIQKEKNRARKLASQSCLNRDVRDDSNLLDLIHKIVPAERMNATAINRSELPNNKSKPNNNMAGKTDKWDVTSLISTCNDEDVSDTYTDEEIFVKDDKAKKEQSQATKQKLKDKGEEQKVTKKQNMSLERIQTNDVEVKQNKPVLNKYTKPTADKQNKLDKTGDKEDTNTQGVKKSLNQGITVVVKENKGKQTKTKNKTQLITTVEEGNNKVDTDLYQQNKPEHQDIAATGKQTKDISAKQSEDKRSKINNEIQLSASEHGNTRDTDIHRQNVFLHQDTTLVGKRTKNLAGKETQDKHSKTKTDIQHIITSGKKGKKGEINTHEHNTSASQDIAATGKQTKVTTATNSTSTIKNKAVIQKQNTSLAQQNTATASKIKKAEKQPQTVVQKEIDDAGKQNNPMASKITPAKFLVVLQKLTPEHVNELSPRDGNGLIKATQGVKSFWDDDTESEFERTPMKRPTQMNSVVSRPFVNRTTVDTVIEDVSSVSELINSSNNKALNVTLQRIQDQASGNKKQTAPKVQKATKDTKQTNKKNSNMDEGANNKGSAKTTAKITVESKTPVKIFKQVNNNSKKAALASKENQPPTNKTCNKIKTPKTKPKLNTTQKKADEAKLDNTVVGECRHLKVHNNTLRIRPQRAPKGKGCRCCDETDSSANDSSLYRSLRSRQVDLSATLKPDDGNSTFTKKPPPKNNRLTKLISKDKEEINLSDLSFTLSSVPTAANRRIRTRSTAVTEESKNKSDVSFSLIPDNKSMNDTTSSRSSKRRGELELLYSNSESFYRAFKRSPLSKRIAPGTLARNRSRSRR